MQLAGFDTSDDRPRKLKNDYGSSAINISSITLQMMDGYQNHRRQ